MQYVATVLLKFYKFVSISYGLHKKNNFQICNAPELLNYVTWEMVTDIYEAEVKRRRQKFFNVLMILFKSFKKSVAQKVERILQRNLKIMPHTSENFKPSRPLLNDKCKFILIELENIFSLLST